MSNQGLVSASSDVDVSVFGNYTYGELDTIRTTLAKDCNDMQFKLFMKTASAMGLNPFLGHIHPVVYGGTLSIQVSVEGYDHKAKQHPEYIGCEVQTVHENDEFEAEQVDKDGQQFFKIITHKVKFPRGKLVGGYAIAKRKGHPDFVVLMEISEVDHLRNGKNDLWKKFEPDMFKKHMKKRALKGQFDLDFDEDEPLTPNLIDVTPSYQPQMSAQQSTASKNSKVIQTGENEFIDQKALLAQKREEVRRKMEQCGMSAIDLDDFAMNSTLGMLPKEMDVRQLIVLSRLLDGEIQQVAQAMAQGSFMDDLPEELR